MRCTHVKDLIAPFLENELAPSTEQLVTEHLKKCATCTDLSIRVDNFEMPNLPTPSVTEILQMHHILEQAIHKELESPPKPRMRTLARIRLPAMPIALAVMGLLGLTLWGPKSNSPAQKIAVPPAIGITTPIKHWF